MYHPNEIEAELALKKTKAAAHKRSASQSARAPVSAIRLPATLTAAVDQWAERKGIHSRSDAIRQLIEKALAASARRLPLKPDGRETTRKISDIAGEQIDLMADQTATDEERASRKRRLLKGPREFRALRKNPKI